MPCPPAPESRSAHVCRAARPTSSSSSETANCTKADLGSRARCGPPHVANLIAIVDRNDHSLDGRIDTVTNIEPLGDKWRAFGWDAHEVDGHDVRALLATFRAIVEDPERTRPAVIIANTVKGKGISYMESEFGWHLGWLAEQDEINAIEELRNNR